MVVLEVMDFTIGTAFKAQKASIRNKYKKLKYNQHKR
jgi:hypothetical protein